MKPPESITIIGAGVVGCALARLLAETTGAEILVAEQAPAVLTENQSSRNSGVVHAGIYYPPEAMPLRARLCVDGNARLYAFCAEHGVPCLRCGKLVVATDDREAEYLDHVAAVATRNGVPGVVRLDASGIREYEPNVTGHSALLVPTSGIVEATALVSKLHDLAKAAGAFFLTGTAVTGLAWKDGEMLVTTEAGGRTETFDTGLVINAAGLYADQVARLLRPEYPWAIEPVRGESARFYRNIKPEADMRGMNVYPAPYGYYNDSGDKADVSYAEFERLLAEGKATRTVGVHLTPTFDGGGDGTALGNTVTIGPMKTVGTGRENYGEGLKAPGVYHRYIQRFFPGLDPDDIGLYQAGIMAVPGNSPDWIIAADDGGAPMINLVGIDSPGLTACLAIASHVRDMLGE